MATTIQSGQGRRPHRGQRERALLLWIKRGLREYSALPEAMEQARSTEGTGDKPLAVVSASDHGGGMMARSRVEAEYNEQAAQALQSELANLSSNSTRRVSEGSDHGSVITNQHHAQQTSEEILKVVEAVRTGQLLLQ